MYLHKIVLIWKPLKRIIGGVKIRMRILNMIPVIQITLLIKLIAIYLKMVKMDMVQGVVHIMSALLLN